MLPLAGSFRDNVLKSMVKFYKEDANARQTIVDIGSFPATFKDPHTHALTGIVFMLEAHDYIHLVKEVEQDKETFEQVLPILRKQKEDLIHIEARKICGKPLADAQ
jgi:hypothetical protein